MRSLSRLLLQPERAAGGQRLPSIIQPRATGSDASACNYFEARSAARRITAGFRVPLKHARCLVCDVPLNMLECQIILSRLCCPPNSLQASTLQLRPPWPRLRSSCGFARGSGQDAWGEEQAFLTRIALRSSACGEQQSGLPRLGECWRHDRA